MTRGKFEKEESAMVAGRRGMLRAEIRERLISSCDGGFPEMLALTASGDEACQDEEDGHEEAEGGVVTDMVMLEENLQRAFMFNTGVLEARRRRFFVAIAQASFSGVAFCSTPVDAMLHKRATILTLFASFLAVTIIQANLDLQLLRDNGVVHASRFRFTRTQARDPACGLLSPGVESFAFFMDGERICGTGCINGTTQESETMLVAFSGEVAFNGYSFRLPKEGSPSCDAVAWTAGTRGPESDWQAVKENLYYKRDRVMPSERRSEVYVELSPSRGVVACGYWANCISSAFGALVPLCSWGGLEIEGVQLGRVVWAFQPLTFIIGSVITIGYFTGTPSEVLKLLLEVGVNVLFVLNIMLQGLYWFQLWALNGIIFLGVGLFLGFVFEAWTAFLVGIMMLGLVVQVLVHRHWTGLNCRRMMETCQTAHESAWRDVYERKNAALLELRERASHMQVSSKEGAVRQYNSRYLAELQHNKAISGERIHSMCGVQSPLMRFLRKDTQIDRTSPATSLSHLYLQASAVQPLLIEKVCEWAEKSAGLFKVSRFGAGRVGGEFVEWRKVKKGRIPASCVQFAEIKHPDRAIEKMYRAYKGDASFLVDLARQDIVFERVEDMVRCLEEIKKDKGVEVERIKNRMDPAYDSNLSAGYRDVLLNVRIVTARAKHMMLDTHVCEVQLLLSSVAKLKCDEGHKIYKAWRNLRGV